MKEKIAELLGRLPKVEKELSQSEVVTNQDLFKKLTQDHAYLTEIKELWELYQNQLKEIEENQAMLKEGLDEDFALEVKSAIELLQKESSTSFKKLETLLVPPDPLDHANIIMEIRAGTGGDEAAIFVGDCIRMYRLFADKMGWNVETLSGTSSDSGGYKEYVFSLSGKNVHRFLKYEAGTHRVQRVPVTETQGRVHTSAITVAVLAEPPKEEAVEIEEKDLKIDTYRASGAGGQHINTTDSAVRITHIPTGVVVYCQEERSQHKNKDKAMRVLSARITEEKKRKQFEERASLRSSQVGSGDRSERIRTYNFPQNRLTDHRIGLTLYKLDQVMEGALEEVSEALVQFYYQKNLETLE